MKNVLVFFFALVAIHVFAATTEAKRSVTVTGHCEIAIKPDLASIVFYVEHMENDAAKASEKTNTLANKLIAGLKDLKLKDSQVSTESYNVFEKREWENNKNVFKGFTAQMGVGFETSEIGKMGKAIEFANKLGLKSISQLNLFTSNALKQKLSLDCLSQATQNAKEKAAKLLADLKANVGDVLEVVESEGSRPQPMPMPVMRFAKGMEAMSADSAPGIEGKTSFYTKDVQFTFEIK